MNAEIVFAPTDIAHGTCGTNATWSLSKDGVLSILGTGNMKDYSNSAAPWSKYRDQITSVEISEGITSIGSCAFYVYSALHSVNIPLSVNEIGSCAFDGCTNLTTVYYGGSEEEWWEINMGYYNELLFDTEIIFTYIDVANGTCGANATWSLSKHGVLYILGTGAMENYSYYNKAPWYEYQEQVKFVEVSDGITSIGNNAFDECISLTSIIIPNSVTSIGNFAFNYCKRLTSIDIPNSVTSIGEWAFNNSGLISINIPNSVTSIGDTAFSFCNGLTSVTLPNSITIIGDNVFQECSAITSITIPKSVTAIKGMAFSTCSSLAKISCLSTEVPTLANDAFSGINTLYKVYVPESAYTDYKNAAGWCDLNIIGVENGDVNLNGTVNITDAVEVINNVLGNPSEKFAEEWSDVNGDNQYTIADASAVINVILGEAIGTFNAKSRTNMGSDDLSIYRTNTNQLTMCMNNKTGYNAFQFDVVLPEDMNIDNVVLNQKRCADFSVMFRETSAGHYTVAVFNFYNAAFATGSGSLLDIITSGVGNDEDIVISNIHFATTKATDIKFEDLMVGEATDINNINIANSTDGSNNIYDLNGRKLQNAKRGVNIINGKKVVNN